MIIHPASVTINVPARDERTRYGIVNGDGNSYYRDLEHVRGDWQTRWTDVARMARTWATEDDPHMQASLRRIQRKEDTGACIVVFHR
jgi:hypothetical protein